MKRIRLSRFEEKPARLSIGFSKCCSELFSTLCSPPFNHRNSRPTSSTRVQGCSCIVSTCAYLVSEAFIFLIIPRAFHFFYGNLKLCIKFSYLEPMSFHALNADCIYLLCVLAGSLDCLHLACNENKTNEKQRCYFE